MAITDPLTAMPTEFMSGTTLKLKRSLADFPASAGWSLKLTLAGKTLFTFTSTPSGDAHLITIPAVAAPGTDDLTFGVYQWSEKALLAGEVYETARGMVTVTPNLEAGTGAEFQQWAEKVLELIEARIAGRMVDGGDAEAFQIGGRSVNLIPIRELFGYRNMLQGQLRSIRAGGTFSREVVMKFTGTGHKL